MDGTIQLRTTLDEGTPLPLFIIADIKSRDNDKNLVIRTSFTNVPLKTTTNTPPCDETNSVTKRLATAFHASRLV